MNQPDEPAEVTMLRALYDAINRNDIDAAVRDLDPEIDWIEPAHYTGSATVKGTLALRAHLTRARSSWAEGSCEPERFFVAGDKVVVFLLIHVRLKSETGWRDGRHAAVYTFRNSKAVEMRIFDDMQRALEWAGVTDANAN